MKLHALQAVGEVEGFDVAVGGPTTCEPMKPWSSSGESSDCDILNITASNNISSTPITIKTGQTHVQKYMPKLLEMIGEEKIDTTFLISHRMPLEDAPKGYKMFKEQQNEVTKVVLKPDWHKEAA